MSAAHSAEHLRAEESAESSGTRVGSGDAAGSRDAASRNAELHNATNQHPAAGPRHESAREPRGVLRRRRPEIDGVAALLALVAFGVYLGFSAYTWANFSSVSWDHGIFTQLADQYARGKFPPIVDIKAPGYNLWGDHFHPILLLTGPLFALWPSGMMLLTLQSALFALSVYPVMKLARERLRFGAIIGVAYALSWGLTSALVVQFHEIAFAVPLLAFGITNWLWGKQRRAAAQIVLLVFVKEDMGLTVFAFGALVLFLAWLGRTKKTESSGTRTRAKNAESSRSEARIGAFLMVWGLTWFILATQVILPAFSGQGAWEYTNRIESDSAPGIFGILLPLDVKLPTIIFIVTSLGIIGCASPWAALLLPTLAWRFAGNNPYYWTILWHYSAVIAPIMFIALIDAASRLKAADHLGSATLRKKIVVCCGVVALGSSLIGTSTNGFGSWATGRGNTQAWNSVPKYGAAQSPAEQAAGRTGIEMVGQGRTVLTDVITMSYVVPGNRVLWEHSYRGAEDEVDTIFFSNRLNHGSGLTVAIWATEHFGGIWEVKLDREAYVVVMKERS